MRPPTTLGADALLTSDNPKTKAGPPTTLDGKDGPAGTRQGSPIPEGIGDRALHSTRRAAPVKA